MPAESTLKFPAKLRPLFQPSRYKVAYGGRGSGKSWGFARALLTLGASRPLRVLCAREVQNSIKESVHRLLTDQIEAMGLSSHYTVLDTEIRGRNGTLFVFAGLLQHTITSIKSYEGVDVCWVEEAQTVSDKSWNILIPTIRKDGSEIWVSFNPDLDSDPTYTRFVENAPPGAVLIPMSWRDNPWWNKVMEDERQHAKATLPKDDYDNVWEGKCRAAVVGAIYAEEVSEAHQQGRVTLLPSDPRLKTHIILDLGWNDSMFAILAQRHLSSLRVTETLEADHKTLAWWSSEWRKRRLNWGTIYLPHDGAHGNIQTGVSARQTLRDLGWRTAMVPNVPVETGIRTARMAMGRTYFDRNKAFTASKPDAEGLVTGSLGECLKRYRRHVNSKTDEAGTPVHDRWSHGADAFRYLGLVAEKLTNDSDEPTIPRSAIVRYEVDPEMGL